MYLNAISLLVCLKPVNPTATGSKSPGSENKIQESISADAQDTPVSPSMHNNLIVMF